MQTSESARNTASALRWCARVIGVLLSGSCLVFFSGSVLEAHSRHPEVPIFSGIPPAGVVGLTLFGIYAVSMVLALRWERICVWLGTGALGLFYVMMLLARFGPALGGPSTESVPGPILLVFWAPIVLYFVCWGVERSARAGSMSAAR